MFLNDAGQFYAYAVMAFFKAYFLLFFICPAAVIT